MTTTITTRVAAGRRLAVLLTAALAFAGVTIIGPAPAHAAPALCPQICLTGGLLKGVGKGSSTAAAGPSLSVLSSLGALGSPLVSRAYTLDWQAVDLTGGRATVRALRVHIETLGSLVDDSFVGAGQATLTGPHTTYVIPVRVTDGGLGLSVQTTGGNRLFSIAPLAGTAGVAHLLTDAAHNW